MARPKKTESDKLTKRVAFRVTEKTYDAYLSKLGENITPSEFFRQAVMTNSTELVVKKTLSYEGKKAIIALAHIGNNINQLAK